MHTKLTLRLDESLVGRAKRCARRRGKSVSQMVADYFTRLEGGASPTTPTPVVLSLRGILKGTAGPADYWKYIETKHR